ncbi:Gfo/Idh/MocA family protein [Patescibacteria group bacterium]
MRFIIIGLGSIGKRHKKNLLSLGHEVIPCHRDDNLEKLLSKNKSDGALICNPTSLHIKTAITTAKAGVNIFLEKPISHNLKGVDELLKLVKKKNLVLMVGYNLRFEPNLAKIKDQLDQQFIGKVKSAKIFVGSYLPDWHLDEDYRQSYSAKKSLGGGVLLDLSHEIDYAIWLFGRAKTIKAKVEVVPKLEIETEGLAELKVKFKSGVTADIHLDYVSRKYKRNLKITGEKGYLQWDYAAIKDSGWDKDEMYIKEVENFIQAVKGKEKPLVTGEEAKHVLEIVEAAKKSSKTGKVIVL